MMGVGWGGGISPSMELQEIRGRDFRGFLFQNAQKGGEDSRGMPKIDQVENFELLIFLT